MSQENEETLSLGLSKTIAERLKPPPPPEDPAAFGRRVARELFAEYVQESEARAERKGRESVA